MSAMKLCLGLALVGTAAGCAETTRATAPPVLAFELVTDAAASCEATGRTRALAQDLVMKDGAVVRAHDGWFTVTFTSAAEGRVTLDVDARTLVVLHARRGGPSAGTAHSAPSAPLFAVDSFGRAIALAVDDAGALRATSLTCPRP